MTDFRFAEPLALLVPLVFWALRWLVGRFGGNDWELLSRFFHERNLALLFPGKTGSTPARLRTCFFSFGVLLLSLALARPQANPQLDSVEQASLDIYVLLDVSRSMDAEDIAPSRLKKAKRSIENLTKLLSGDRVGIIAFAGTAVIVSPLTSDYDVIASFLESVDTSIIENQGTQIEKALEVAHTAMKRGAERVGGATRSNVFIVMSDGEDHEQPSLSVAEKIRAEGGVIFTIALGTERGAPIPVRSDGITLQAYKRDRQGNQVVTKVQTKSLEDLASRGGGKFYFSTIDEGEIRDLVAQMKNMQRTGAAAVKAIQYEEYFQFPLLVGIILLSLALGPTGWPLGGFPWTRQKKSRSTVRNLAVALFSLLTLSPAASALEPPSWLASKDRRLFQQAQALAKEGKADEAAALLAPLLAENPNAEDLRFNVGSILAQGSKKEDGQKQLDTLAKENSSLAPSAAFNSAGAAANAKKVEEARARYAELLWKLQENKTPSDLKERIRNNLLAMAEENPQQQQNQQQQGQGEGQQEQKQKDPSQGSSEQNPKEGEDKEKKSEDKGQGEQEKKVEKEGPNDKPEEKGQEKESEQKGEGQDQPPTPPQRRGRQPFKEQENLSEADAKSILETLNEREGRLQKKFLKRKEQKDRDTENDSGNDW